MNGIIGTQLYSSESQTKTPIYPKSKAEVIDAINGNIETNVQQWLSNLTTSIGQITENAIKLNIKISYAQTTYKNLDDIKDNENIQWGENFVQPDAEFPYTWKKTEIKASSSAESSATSVAYELASVSSQSTQTIYTARSADTKAVTVAYNSIDDQGASKPYYNDTLENILAKPENALWSKSPVSISATNPNGYIATRTRTNTGEWGAFNIAQNAKWAYNSIPVYKYKVTDTIQVPPVTENSDDYSKVEGWKDQITESFTGYLWMINATVVNDVYQLNGSTVWSSPTLISIVNNGIQY